MRKLNQILALAATVTFGSLVRTAPAADPAPVIAIANLDKIRDSLAEWKDVMQQMELDERSYNQERADKEKTLKDEEGALAYVTPGTQAYVDKANEFHHDTVTAEIELREKQNSIDLNLKAHLKQIFLEIQDAVAVVAQKDGISLVIADQRPAIPDDLVSIQMNELQARIAQRTVLFSDQSRDISGEVITLLDKNYAAKAAAPSAVTPAPAQGH